MIIRKFSSIFICSCLALAFLVSCGLKNQEDEYDSDGYKNKAKKLLNEEITFNSENRIAKVKIKARPKSNDFYVIPQYLILNKGDLEGASLSVSFKDSDNTKCEYSGLTRFDNINIVPFKSCNNKAVNTRVKWDQASDISLEINKSIHNAQVLFLLAAYLPSELE